jgi:signal transduction histidine kinase
MRSVSHEFRTPLAVINMNLYLMGRADPSRAVRLREGVAQQTRRLERLVEDMVTMSRIQSGVMNDMRTMELHGIIIDAQVMAAQDLLNDGARVDVQRWPVPVFVQGEWEQLVRALSNLIRNASQHTPPDGVVQVRVVVEGQQAVIEICDRGSGMDKMTLERIFEPFYRGDEAHTTPGFGIGLSIAQAAVTNHGGSIDVESEPNVGSTFRVRLPVLPVEATPLPAPNAVSAPQHVIPA